MRRTSAGRFRALGAVVVAVALASCSSAQGGSVSTPPVVTSGSSTAASPVGPSLTSDTSSSADVTEPASVSSSSALTGPESSASWPPNLTIAEQVSAQAALAAYAGMWATYDASTAAPDQKWLTQIQQFSTGAVAANAAEFLLSLQRDQQHQSGSTTLTSAVLSVTGNTVTVQGCVDSGGVTLIDNASGSALPDEGPVQAAYQTAVVEKQGDGVFRVAQLINPNPVQPC